MINTVKPKTDQLNADDLIGGRTMTIKVTKVSLCAGDQPIAINFEGDNNKPYKPCKSMRRVLVKCWGENGNSYIGRSMTLYCDESVTFGGNKVGGIRISHMSDIKETITMALTASKANRKPYTVKPLAITKDKDISLLLTTGKEKSALGKDAYTEWLATLSAEDKASIKHMHAEWTAKALAASPKQENWEIVA